MNEYKYVVLKAATNFISHSGSEPGTIIYTKLPAGAICRFPINYVPYHGFLHIESLCGNLRAFSHVNDFRDLSPLEALAVQAEEK